MTEKLRQSKAFEEQMQIRSQNFFTVCKWHEPQEMRETCEVTKEVGQCLDQCPDSPKVQHLRSSLRYNFICGEQFASKQHKFIGYIIYNVSLCVIYYIHIYYINIMCVLVHNITIYCTI